MMLRDTLGRLSAFRGRRAIERRLDDEMTFHVDMLAETYERRGLPPGEARRAALVAFGGRERFKDDARDEYRSHRLEELGQDTRYGLRVLRRNPGFTAAAILTFALGIGATTAVFSVVHGVLLRPLPYAEPGRLVVLWERNVARGKDRNVVGVENFEAWRERSRSFDDMAALVPAPVTVTGANAPERSVGAEVSPGYFRILGVAAALGRVFTADEAKSGARVVVLSNDFWKSRFGGDRSVLGQTLTLDGRPHAVVGVMPAGFDPPRFFWLGEQPFWLPFAATPANRSWGRFLLVVARLRPDVTLDAARAEMLTIAEQRAQEVPSNRGWSVSIVGLAEQITGDVRSQLLVLLAAVGLLLLMAVTNVANLTLALTRRRAQELAVRRAIGATSRRLVRQLVTQSVLLGTIGSAVGVAVAIVGVRLLLGVLPPDIPRTSSIRVDAPVLLFTTLTAVIATLVVGGVAALRGAGREATREGAAPGGARGSARVGGGMIVSAEIALGLVLSIIAGLMVRTFVTLRAVDLGFDSASVIVARVGLSGNRYATPDAKRAFFDAVLERTRALPGVRAASLVSTRPFGGAGPATIVTDAARPLAKGSEPPVTDVRVADAELFRALGVPVLTGTTFAARERADGPPRVVINRTMARMLWPSENPIGQRMKLELFDGITAEVIGVVGDVHLLDTRTPPRPTAYLAAARFPSEVLDVVVKGAGASDALVSSLRQTVAAVDATIPVYDVSTLGGIVDESLAGDRFTTLVLGAFAVLALLLAGVGIYGVLSGDVAQRRKEIGIRLALGARGSGVVLLVMRRALIRAITGLALGTVAALLLTRSMSSLLFGVGASDPASFLTVSAILLGVAVVATLIPAVRAARVSPLVAIRTD